MSAPTVAWAGAAAPSWPAAAEGLARRLAQGRAGVAAAVAGMLSAAATASCQRRVARPEVQAVLDAVFGPDGEISRRGLQAVLAAATPLAPALGADVARLGAAHWLAADHLRRVAHYLDAAAAGDPPAVAELAEHLGDAARALQLAGELEGRLLAPALALVSAAGQLDAVETALADLEPRLTSAPPHVTPHAVAGVLWA